MDDERLRVALLSYRSQRYCGGQGVYVRHLSRELAALGHHVEVLSGQPYPVLDEPVVLQQLPSLDLYAEPHPFRSPAPWEYRDLIDVLEFWVMCTAGFPEPLTFSLRALRHLYDRRNQFDVVHDNQSLGYGLLGVSRVGLPLVATIHHPVSVDRRVDLAAAEGLLRKLTLRRWYGFVEMQQRVARRLEHLITVSESSAQDIVADLGVQRDQLQVVPAGVDTATFRPRDQVRRVPGRIVTTASADVPLKGLRVLLEAIAKLRTERDVEVVVVGSLRPDGPTDLTLDRLGLRDVVTFRSGIADEELARLLASASVAVVPSLYEGFSLPAAEAMACATAVVASATGALPEVVGPDGETSLHVPPGDVEALVAALRRVLDDPELAARLGAAGRDRVLERFTWRRAAQATVEVYRAAVGAQGARAC